MDAQEAMGALTPMQVRQSGVGVIVGRVLVHVMAARDGSTLFWAVGQDKEPLAMRWQPAMGPWRVRQGCAHICWVSKKVCGR